MKYNRVKVCFIIPTLDPGGIETYTLRFIKYSKNFIEPHIIVRSNFKGKLYEDYLNETNNIYFQPLGYFNVYNLSKYLKLFKKIRPNTVVDFNANFAGLTMLIAKIIHIEKRIAFYRQGKNHYKNSFLRNIYNKFSNQLVFKYSTAILSNSQASIDFFFPYIKSHDIRFEVIPNGIKISDYDLIESKEKIRISLNLPRGAFIIGNVGRHDPLKNHITILKVAKKLIELNKNVHFVFCGIGTEKLNLLVEKMKLKEFITILGFRRDVPRVLKALDLFFFPSISEGQPNALLEAMISGIEFISSNIPSIVECVPESKYSNLFNFDDVLGFQEAILRIIDNQEIEKDVIKKLISNKFDSNINFELFLKKIK